MSGDTAPVQSPVCYTVKQLAGIAEVSPRMMAYALKLRRLHPELGSKIESGELRMIDALYETGIRRRRGKYAELVAAWNACSEDQRAVFLSRVLPGSAS